MPLYKVTGRFWVALDLADFISQQPKPQGSDYDRENGSGSSNNSNGNGNRGENKGKDSYDGDNSDDKAIDPSWGVVNITNRAIEVRNSGGSSSSCISSQSTPASIGTGIGTGRVLQDFSVPVGVSSKRRRSEDGLHIVLDVDAGVKFTEEGYAQALAAADGEKLRVKGEFVMPTGMGVSNKRGLGLGSSAVKRDAKSPAAEREVDQGREKDKERESGVLERRILYEASVRHTTLGLDMSLSHIHKFVGHRYDHDMYTQVSTSLLCSCVALVLQSKHNLFFIRECHRTTPHH